jgi:hypothetical protein
MVAELICPFFSQDLLLLQAAIMTTVTAVRKSRNKEILRIALFLIDIP